MYKHIFQRLRQNVYFTCGAQIYLYQTNRALLPFIKKK